MELTSSSLFVSMHSNRNFNTSLDCWLVGEAVGEEVPSWVVALSFSSGDLRWRSISDLGKLSLKRVVVPIPFSNTATGWLGHFGERGGCDCQMIANLLLLWPGSDNAVVEKLLLL